MLRLRLSVTTLVCCYCVRRHSPDRQRSRRLYTLRCVPDEGAAEIITSPSVVLVTCW